MRQTTAFLLAFTVTATAVLPLRAQSLPPGSPGATPPVDRLAPRTMVATNAVTIHAQPSTSSAAIGSLKPGQRVQVINGNGESGWYRLASGGFAIMDHLAPAEAGSGSSTRR
jgi:uncharacterized protein YgiM (DUF1202 family)